MKHLLTLSDISETNIYQLINRANELKQQRDNGKIVHSLKDKTLAMIFEKPSTRTRVSFEAGIKQLGGNSLFITNNDSQLGRGEPIRDSAIVISSMVDLVMIRTFEHSKLIEFAKYSSVPVINGLTNNLHPCQLLADLQTIYNHFQQIKDLTIAWVGDGNNMCNSYIEASNILGFKLNVHSPEGYESHWLNQGKNTTSYLSAQECVKNCDVIVTDVWSSMGQEQEQTKREKAFKNCQVNQQLMQQAKENAIFLHCLPAHRGEEVTAEVIDGKQSLIWQEAENRLHAQKALMEFLLSS